MTNLEIEQQYNLLENIFFPFTNLKKNNKKIRDEKGKFTWQRYWARDRKLEREKKRRAVRRLVLLN